MKWGEDEQNEQNEQNDKENEKGRTMTVLYVLLLGIENFPLTAFSTDIK